MLGSSQVAPTVCDSEYGANAGPKIAIARFTTMMAMPIQAVTVGLCPSILIVVVLFQRLWRSRGLTRMIAMSASVLSTTKTIANTRPQAWITGTSRLDTASTINCPMPG
jgi:hypothetical protein